MQSEHEISILARDGMVNGNEFRAVGKGSFHLHIVDHIRNAGHNLVSPEQLTAKIHQLSHAPAVADKFEDHSGDERHGFGMIQPQTAREAFLRHATGLMQRQFVEFTRRQVHGQLPFVRPRIIA